MNYPTMPSVPPEPPQKEKRKFSRTDAMLGLIVGALFGAAGALGVYSLADGDPKSSSGPVSSSVSASETPVVGVPSPGPEYSEPTADDFEIELITKEKQCFGSAGCNVTVKPELSYTGMSEDLNPDVTYEITYEIRGGEDGAVTETLELTNQDDVTYSDTYVSTTSSGVKLSVKITGVDSY